MDAKRLDGLVELAECESKYFTYRGPCSEKDLLDLARCAAAWSKVERMLRDHSGSSIDFVWTPERGVLILTVDLPRRSGTAIEAVESLRVI